MPVYGAADIRVAIRDSGVVVIIGATTTRGLDDSLDEELLRGQLPHLIGRARQVVLDATETGVLAAVVSKASITVDGQARKIHSHELLDDGGLVRIVTVTVN